MANERQRLNPHATLSHRNHGGNHHRQRTYFDIRNLTMQSPFIVFYQWRGEELSRYFQTMREAKGFALFIGGRVESRLTNLLEI
jgi:hypothetical protein